MVPVDKFKSVNAIARRHQRRGLGKFTVRRTADGSQVTVWRTE